MTNFSLTGSYLRVFTITVPLLLLSPAFLQDCMLQDVLIFLAHYNFDRVEKCYYFLFLRGPIT